MAKRFFLPGDGKFDSNVLRIKARPDVSVSEMSGESRKKTVHNLALQVTRRLYEIRCSKKMYRIITGMEYDKEGTLIDGIISSNWEGIKPDSIIEKLFETVCR